jgi:hypothetical protein
MPHPPRPNRPQISTMPRPTTDATQHLERYKTAIEKRRLETELAAINLRRQQIEQRMAVLEQQAAVRSLNPVQNVQPTYPSTPHPRVLSTNDVTYTTFTLEY